MSDVIGLSDLKAMMKNGDDVVGLKFLNGKGSTGTVLAKTAEGGKFYAVMSCTVKGCTEVHTRASSDWHQCSKCNACNKTVKTVKTAKTGETVNKVVDPVARQEARVKLGNERIQQYIAKIRVETQDLK